LQREERLLRTNISICHFLMTKKQRLGAKSGV
jgi:hypothetical protein